MLKQWSIWNFKSVGERIDLDCKALTLLVGANSSGKSSIIQTLLLVKQTLQYGAAQHAVLLNGPLVRLGNFNDVKNALSRLRTFGLGFDLSVDEDHVRQFSRGMGRGMTPFRWSTTKIRTISCSFEVGLDSLSSTDSTRQQPFLRSTHLIVGQVKEKDTSTSEISAKRARPLAGAKRSFEALRQSSGQQMTDLRLVRTSKDVKRELEIGRPVPKVHGAKARFFIPEAVLVSFDSKLKAAQEIPDYLASAKSYLEVPASGKASILAAAKEAVDTWITARGAPREMLRAVHEADGVQALGQAIAPVVSRLSRSSVGLRTSINALLGLQRPSATELQDLQALKDNVSRAILKLPQAEFEMDYAAPRFVGQALYILQEYFRYGVRYLGPLREPPKPLYPLEPLPDPTDVGYMGEHTAAVYDLNKQARIQYVRPSPDGSASRRETRTATLHAAVVDWLSHMGVISEIDTSDRGKFGRELQVQSPGLSKYHDLTNVGVGVSQVLPIVVMSLLAKKGSLLVFEQPELHLHPKVQARLADFFIAMADSGKQSIIETHSEYLIYRLRRRIAESDTGKDDDLVSLYFVERDRGETNIRKVSINKFGALSEWPKDFFDQSQSEAEHILRAAAIKHRSQSKPEA